MKPLLISTVVIGRNEGSRLDRCLASLTAMRLDGFTTETIYVDSGSTDESVGVAVTRGARVIALRSPRPTAALGRNAGWRAASGSIVLFLDGDTILHPDFVADSLAAFNDPTIAVVWGHRRETLATRSVYNRVLDLDWIYPAGYVPFCGGDALFLRSTLELTGGFDDTLIAGEEPELCRRITGRGLRILHVDRPMTGHDLGITRFAQYWRRATRAGHAFAEVSARFSHSEAPFWLSESRRNSRNAIILIALPLLGAVCSRVARSPWPFLFSVALLLALAVRTSWKARWKSQDRIALALYGVHSHLQQIPIFIGQLRFWMNRRRGNRAELVEYKQP
jgi:cellulose synthase/poly-beta-1,6-N-acetylglucosamine synthase-like glycosyltransferase